MPIRPLGIPIKELFDDTFQTGLSADVNSGSSSLTVESIRDFAIDKILFIGELGSETAEIIKTHGATAPTGSTITLASNTEFKHYQGDKIYVIDYDQIEFSHATTTTGVKTVISTDDIDPDSVDTIFKDETYSSGYYFVRFKNSIDSSYSEYSDPIPYDGYADNTVGKAIAYSLKRNKTEYTENVDHDFLIEEINLCLQFIRGELKKWHSLQDFDYIAGQTSRGVNKIAMPSDAHQNSNKSILGVRVGSSTNLTYKDKTEWEDKLDGVEHSTTTGAVVGATTITLANSYDFEESGTVMIKGQEITYTNNTQATGVLSGIPASGTGSITATIDSGDDVWQEESEGEPEFFTIYEKYLYFWPLASSSHINKNIFMDYWKEAPSVDSDNDEIDSVRYEMIKYWLTWVIRSQIKNDGLRDENDTDFKMFLRTLKKAITIELKTNAQKYKTKPRLNKLQR